MAKTMAPGEIQSVFLTVWGNLHPIAALINLAIVVSITASDFLFLQRDDCGDVRPTVKRHTLDQINNILAANSFGTSFGHFFHIDSALFYLLQKIDPKIIRLAGRQMFLAYEVYIWAFEQVTLQHLTGL